jgi:LPXTG-motif cell wall-anchored protein
VGCTSPPPSGHSPTPVTKVADDTVVPDDALAFTGADIEGMTVIGGGALLMGGVLVRRNRRRNRAHA